MASKATLFSFFFFGIFEQLFCIILYSKWHCILLPCCVWVGDFLSFIHLKQKNDNLKFLWIKQMDFYNSYKK